MRWPTNVNWLIVLIASWAIPVFWPLSYLFSLVFWLLPIVVLLPDFLAATDSATRRRRRAVVYASLWIVILGIVLDFGLGRWILTFQADWYLFRIFGIPIEEVLFYVLGPVAILLVYSWADEHWLRHYNQSTSNPSYLRAGPPLLKVSPRMIGIAVALLAVVVAIKSYNSGRFAVPLYATFIVLGAFVPAMAVYRSIGEFVNWRAFGATTMYLIGTSLAYEVTLAVPLGWWGYQDAATMEVFIPRWSSPLSRFPLEAAAVWIAAPFSSVLTYEWVKAYLHHPARSWRSKLGI